MPLHDNQLRNPTSAVILTVLLLLLVLYFHLMLFPEPGSFCLVCCKLLHQ